MTKSNFLKKDVFNPIGIPALLPELRVLKKKVDEYAAFRAQTANDWNEILRNGSQGGLDMLSVLRMLSENCYIKQLRANLDLSQSRQHSLVVADQYNPELRNWASLVMYDLSVDPTFGISDLSKLRRLLIDEKLEFIPALKIRAEMEAFQFYTRKKITPGDQYDITRAACCLPYSDVFITDGGKAKAIRELKLDKLYETEVFSLSKGDLPALKSRLQQMLS